MSKQIQNLKNRVLNKNKTVGKHNLAESLIDMHDVFMAEYGYVPLEEFRDLPAETIFNLLDAAARRHKRQAKKMPKAKKPTGRRRL